MSNAAIEEISQRSREAILSKVRRAWRRPDFQRVESTDPAVHIRRSAGRVEDMIERMRANRFSVEQCQTGELEDRINAIVAVSGLKSMMYPADVGLDMDRIQAAPRLPYDRQIEELRHEVFSADIAVIRARAGVASHGVALVVSTPEQPRLLSLAPTLCIMLLRREDVVDSLVDALHLVRQDYPGQLPTNILFIAGPSRTSDIELVTVFGVHGPQQVHILIH